MYQVTEEPAPSSRICIAVLPQSDTLHSPLTVQARERLAGSTKSLVIGVDGDVSDAFFGSGIARSSAPSTSGSIEGLPPNLQVLRRLSGSSTTSSIENDAASCHFDTEKPVKPFGHIHRMRSPSSVVLEPCSRQGSQKKEAAAMEVRRSAMTDGSTLCRSTSFANYSPPLTSHAVATRTPPRRPARLSLDLLARLDPANRASRQLCEWYIVVDGQTSLRPPSRAEQRMSAASSCQVRPACSPPQWSRAA